MNFDKNTRSSLLEYAHFVMMYNSSFNLTGAKSEEDFFENQISDSLSALDYFTPFAGEVIYDIGSGSGLPGIPLAIVMKKTRFILIERGQKRVNFLKLAISHLGLSDRVEVQLSDLKDIKGVIRVATFRALGDFSEIQSSLYKALYFGGSVLCYKGRMSEAVSERVDERLFLRKIEPYSFSGKERCMVILKKI